MNGILFPLSSSWTGFALCLVIEAVVLGVPCVALVPRTSREFLARLVAGQARVSAGEWLALVAVGLTFPGVGLLTLLRLLRAAPVRAWSGRQLLLAWTCIGTGAFGFLFFALVYGLAFAGPVRTLALLNLAAGLGALPLLGIALTLTYLLRPRAPERGPHAAS